MLSSHDNCLTREWLFSEPKKVLMRELQIQSSIRKKRRFFKGKLGKKTGFKSTSKPVVRLDKDTMEVLEEFSSVREAGRKCFFPSNRLGSL